MTRESSKPMSKPFGFIMPEACLLDRLADAELMLGHVAQAERLASRAAELWETGR